MKKAIIKAVTFAGILSLLGACSSMTNVPERDTYAMPKWYKKCEQSGTEGWFWWEEEYVYSLISELSGIKNKNRETKDKIDLLKIKLEQIKKQKQ